jgi:hypothetical protein
VAAAWQASYHGGVLLIYQRRLSVHGDGGGVLGDGKYGRRVAEKRIISAAPRLNGRVSVWAAVKSMAQRYRGRRGNRVISQ